MRWVRALLAFVGVIVGGLLIASQVGFGVGQFELLILLSLAVAAAVAAYRPDIVRLRRVA